jgi:P2-related tail formation protein
MCVMSLVVDHYYDKWQQQPTVPPLTYPSVITINQPQIPQADIDEFYKLLEKAREYDRKHNQPDCELQSKKDRLTALAKELGVEINFP